MMCPMPGMKPWHGLVGRESISAKSHLPQRTRNDRSKIAPQNETAVSLTLDRVDLGTVELEKR